MLARIKEESSELYFADLDDHIWFVTTFVVCDACGRSAVFSYATDQYQIPTDDHWNLTRPRPPSGYLSELIPEKLKAEYYEAAKCFNAKAFRAAVVMAGRVIEGACVDHGVTKGMLGQMLDTMRDLNLIDEAQYDVAQDLRGLRNRGAHFLGAHVGCWAAQNAMFMCEAFLDYTYVTKLPYEESKRLRQIDELQAPEATAPSADATETK
ncbi:DUF4145 domain-containing protein [Actinopolymorpha sp. B11F2]|uniref:DUF4145 domain-containing protein n=1 Tax=Actinopolymorpha sp. B11F2 TaxID=3160862 RepID=UPI0032E385B9